MHPGALKPLQSRFFQKNLRVTDARLFRTNANALHRVADGDASSLGSFHPHHVPKPWRWLATKGVGSTPNGNKNGCIPLSKACQTAAMRKAIAANPCGFQQTTVPTLPKQRSIVHKEWLLTVIGTKTTNMSALPHFQRGTQIVEFHSEC